MRRATRPLAETAPTGPSDAYGRHKLAVEHALRELLGERLTVLRLANVFGYERGAGPPHLRRDRRSIASRARAGSVTT